MRLCCSVVLTEAGVVDLFCFKVGVGDKMSVTEKLLVWFVLLDAEGDKISSIVLERSMVLMLLLYIVV